MTTRLRYIYDAELQLKDDGLVAASGAATLYGFIRVLDVGRSLFEGVLVIDVSAVEIASNNELYTVAIQGSSSSTFASDVQNLAMIDFGATEVRKGGAIDSTPGRYLLPFVNMPDDVIYPYLRVYTTVSGSVATGIDYVAWVSKA